MNEREVVCDVLVRICDDGAYNNIALREALADTRLTSGQKAFVTEVVNGVLRNFIYVDFLLDKAASLPSAKMRPIVRAALRSAIYQLRFMTSAKNFAVCNETVAIVKRRGLTQLAGFVNGVLRRFTGSEKFPLPDKDADPASYISVVYSVPLWLAKSWIETFGFEKAERICAVNNAPPRVTACVNTTKTDKAALTRLLTSLGVVVENGALSPNALLLSKTGEIAEMAPFKQGLFHVADESGLAAVEALDPQPGERVLDVCAAPGGKAFYAAELMKNSGEVRACDIHAHKVRLIADGAFRLGLGAVKALERDASVETASFKEAFDKVLVDAPCSGLGVLRKKPDIRMKKAADNAAELAALQRSILAASAPCVKVGGTLLYSTCTLSKAENEENADWFAAEFPAFREVERRLITPDEYGSDGFFTAKFTRTGAGATLGTGVTK